MITYAAGDSVARSQEAPSGEAAKKAAPAGASAASKAGEFLLRA